MKAFLMYPDRDFNPQQALPPNAQTLVDDLGLETLFQAMAQGDGFLEEIARQALLSSLCDLEIIRYRQEMLKDCLNNPEVIRALYRIPVESGEIRKRHLLGNLSRYPSGILSSSIEMLETFLGLLKKLRRIADESGGRFASPGFTAFFAMIRKELEDAYLARVEAHLAELKFPGGVLVSARLGKGNCGADYVLRKPQAGQKMPAYSLNVHPHDELGRRALADIKERGLQSVANALAQSADHIDAFFNTLRVELAFYVGCLNLGEQLARQGRPVCFPTPVPLDQRRHSFEGLYDACLALEMKPKVVANELEADGKDMVLITGAGQGGKSTFLRSLGLAQLMMQCGMFVPADSFSANLCSGLFTHYRRQEDVTMKSGKLDEELTRMSQIVDQVQPGALILFNESFAATNEREGSEIARQIVSALLEWRIKLFFVTHLYEFARGLYEKQMGGILFLRAERTYQVIPGEPLPTTHGRDLYQKIFKE